MSRLKGKIALVTGASRGIGRAIAIELAKEGASVIINYSKDDAGASETLNEIRKINGYAILLKKSVDSNKNCKEIYEASINALGKVDILVNNAGVSSIGLYIDANEENFNNIINTNLMGTMYLSKYVLQDMILRKSGSIVNISSMWGEVGASCEVLYSTTKGAINSFTKALAKEMGMSNIRVNAVAPGVINTSMNDVLDDESKNQLIQEIPMGRFGISNEIAKIVTFLCSDDSSYITGQIIRADGGFI